MENTSKHIILGAGGAISSVLTGELLKNGENVKLVSRSSHGWPGAEAVKADLADPEQTVGVIEENATTYLLAGLPYDINIWRELWPKIMRNTIEACAQKNARLIFFDNVYSYGKVDGAMTEDTPMKPSSKKGEVRAKIAEELLNETAKGKLTAIIARAADFYGPYAEAISLPFIFMFKRMAAGKKAQVLVDAHRKHSFTYTPDCGRSLVMLAKTEDAFNQVWHLPTVKPPLTGEEFLKIAAEKMNAKPGYTVLKKGMIKMVGWFDKTSREVHEMLYQNEYDYIFDSSKFEKRFNFTTTAYEQGIEETIKFFRDKKVF